jgi:hypothetical protein
VRKYFVLLFCAALVFIFACKKKAGPAAPSGKTLHTAVFQYQLPPDGTYSGVHDTSIKKVENLQDFGNCDTLNIGVSVGINVTDVARAIIKFDVSSLPVDADVVGVTLNVLLSGMTDTTTIDAYAVSTAWDEGPDCGGIDAAGNTASWNGPWASAGGDFGNSINAASVVIDYNINIFWQGFDIDPAVVKQWSIDPGSNNGIILKAQDELTGGSASFHSKETASAADGPKLTVYYLY